MQSPRIRTLLIAVLLILLLPIVAVFSIATWHAATTWTLSVVEPAERAGFSVTVQSKEDCDRSLAFWRKEAATFKVEGHPENAPIATCHRYWPYRDILKAFGDALSGKIKWF